MKDQNKKSKKKILLYYLILAACLLVIAAVTVTVIFTVGKPNDGLIDNKPNQGITNPDDDKKPNEGENPGDNKPNEGDNKPDDNKPTSGDNKYGLPLTTATVTTSYEFAYDVTLDRYCVHQGMDFDAAAGTQVCAVLDGTIKEIVTDHILGENYVTVAHANNTITTYKYITAKEGLKVGAAVKRGDVLGTVQTANGMEMKQGDHLHFEISVNGKSADPNVYLEITEK